MNHRSLVSNWHSTPDSKGAREELDNKGLELENVLDSSAIKKANNFWNARSSSSWLVEHQDTAGHQKDQGVANGKGECSWEVLFLNIIRREFPLELRDNVNDLMEKEAKHANGEAYNPHHEPSETEIGYKPSLSTNNKYFRVISTESRYTTTQSEMTKAHRYN